jgi:hypothetical protein
MSMRSLLEIWYVRKTKSVAGKAEITRLDGICVNRTPEAKPFKPGIRRLGALAHLPVDAIRRIARRHCICRLAVPSSGDQPGNAATLFEVVWHERRRTFAKAKIGNTLQQGFPMFVPLLNRTAGRYWSLLPMANRLL